MGKRFGELGVTIRGLYYYVISPHEQKAYANAIKKGIPNVIRRTSQTIWRWLPSFIVGYVVYRYAEYENWSHHRKNLKEYLNEVPPPPPKMCRRVKEPKPQCKKDWEYEEYECGPGEEPDEEFAKIMEERNAEMLAAERGD